MRAMRIATLHVLVGGLLAMSCASAKRDEPQRAAHEVVSGGARIRGGGVRMDVQIGRPSAQRTMKAKNVAAHPAAVVTP